MAATVDLPTPPLPEATATTLATSGSGRWRRIGDECRDTRHDLIRRAGLDSGCCELGIERPTEGFLVSVDWKTEDEAHDRAIRALHDGLDGAGIGQ